MDLPAGVFLLCMINVLVEVPLHRPVATGRVRGEPAARAHGDLGRLLHRLHGEIFGCLEDDRPLATDPGDDGRPIFVIMAPTGLAFLAAPTRAVPQRFLPALFGSPLVAGGMVEVIRFYRAFQLAVHFIGQGRIAEPPAPAVARPARHPELSGDAPR